MMGQVGMRLRVLYPCRGERMSPSINQQSAKQLRPSSKLFDSYHDVLWGAVSMSGGALSCALQCQQLPTLQLVPARRSTRTSTASEQPTTATRSCQRQSHKHTHEPNRQGA
jgi:hypothetical protein